MVAYYKTKPHCSECKNEMHIVECKRCYHEFPAVKRTCTVCPKCFAYISSNRYQKDFKEGKTKFHQWMKKDA